jgi:hypothetical protein
MGLIIFEKGLTLYRSDYVQPPKGWDSSHAKNTQYVYDDGIGPKNQAGYFFFFDNEELAHDLGNEHQEKFPKRTSYFLTKCKTLPPLSILDFSCCQNLAEMFDILADNGIDILTKDFFTYMENKPPHHERLSKFKEVWNNRNQEEPFDRKNLKLHSQISDCLNVSLMGQRLSDFRNGKFFREKLLNGIIKFDGYRWREHCDPRGITYCICSNSKLSKPESIEIPMNLRANS